MYNLDRKQKMLLGIIIVGILGLICYFVYAKDAGENMKIENELEIENQPKEGDDNKQTENEETILVYVTGAVNKQGLVELKENDRISNAIDKARWYNTRCLY